MPAINNFYKNHNMLLKDKIILVFTFDQSIDHKSVKASLDTIQEKFGDDESVHMFFCMGKETKVECINPRIVNNDEEIKKLEKVLKEAQEYLIGKINQSNDDK